MKVKYRLIIEHIEDCGDVLLINVTTDSPEKIRDALEGFEYEFEEQVSGAQVESEGKFCE